ncbi:hypothetical protein StoSoilB20_26990 [Arthrobacter sp. StoSoilB20]|nr:hypothetical protein StoSoilB20_26990 [Arthrobacter sp. StoSoilB20]
MRTGTVAAVPSEGASTALDPVSSEGRGSKWSFTRFCCLFTSGKGLIQALKGPDIMIIATLSGARNGAAAARWRAFGDVAPITPI